MCQNRNDYAKYECLLNWLNIIFSQDQKSLGLDHYNINSDDNDKTIVVLVICTILQCYVFLVCCLFCGSKGWETVKLYLLSFCRSALPRIPLLFSCHTYVTCPGWIPVGNYSNHSRLERCLIIAVEPPFPRSLVWCQAISASKSKMTADKSGKNLIKQMCHGFASRGGL